MEFGVSPDFLKLSLKGNRIDFTEINVEEKDILDHFITTPIGEKQ